MTKLEIGGGTTVPAGWENIDPVHGTRPEFKIKAQAGIPLPDNSVSEVRASHVMEHIPAGEDRVNVMNDIWRVLKPGGRFTIIVPVVGYTALPELFPGGDSGPHPVGWQAWADPTHVSFWWYPESFYYFTGRLGPNADYGLKKWDEVSLELRDTWEANVVLAKPQR